jgi:hypothetical protein
MTDEQAALVKEKVASLRQELAELGVESSFFYRAPGSAKAPVGFLLIGETQADLEAARNA